jgi:hypothetical protein
MTERRPKKLLDQARDAIRLKHDSYRIGSEPLPSRTILAQDAPLARAVGCRLQLGLGGTDSRPPF